MMKVSRAVGLSMAVLFYVVITAWLKSPVVCAQAENGSTKESVLELQITANDEISASNVSAHQMHLRPMRSASHRAVEENAAAKNRKLRGESSQLSSPFSSASFAGVSA